jgi:dTDP-D-glucose 4,6-dehydratase
MGQTVCRDVHLSGKCHKARPDPDAFEPDAFAIDATRIRSELGWRPQEDFDSGIRRTVQWYLDNAWWWRPIRERKYMGERLGRATSYGSRG